MAHQNVSDAIRRSIESDIEQGRLLPGQVIDERSLAEAFSVSRTPVRQALQQLHGQGVVEVIPRVGARVPKLSTKDLLLIYEMLAELEAAAARLAARRITAREAHELRGALDACQQSAQQADPTHYSGANRALHELIYEASRNPLLSGEIRKLRAKERAYQLSRFDRPGGMAKSAREHAAIVTAIVDGNPDEASKVMRNHILIGAEEFLDYVATLPDFEFKASGEDARRARKPGKG